ncbi:MAG: insulinase family protein [Oscillospiraceae bacterium]|nr:insulinase family protein [Oscillospiraceae bacterium]
MEKQIIASKRLGEEYIKVQHPTGLTILLCPMKGFSTAYAQFGTKYGSVDTRFRVDGEEDFAQVPEGIAHFLEHKLFECEDGVDAFERYAKTGASANAFTSFDKTCYLFTCSENFEESLEILLDFVTHPYFTQKTVEKEQGIIGQEIRMYDDNADWRVYFNLLGALYHNHPVRIDIAGTVESIAEIDAELLYRCYNTFYNLHNMVLTIAGNFDVDSALAVADKVLKPAKPIKIESIAPEEPESVYKARVEQEFEVAMPMFQIGYKGIADKDPAVNMENMVLDEILMEVLMGETSPLYETLYTQGLISSGFAGEVMSSRDYYCSIFSGESKDPDKVYDLLRNEIESIKTKGIAKEDFERAKKSIYGRYLSMYSRADSIAGLMTQAYFSNVDAYYVLEKAADATLEKITERLKTYDNAKSAISIVKPISA